MLAAKNDGRSRRPSELARVPRPLPPQLPMAGAQHRIVASTAGAPRQFGMRVRARFEISIFFYYNGRSRARFVYPTASEHGRHLHDVRPELRERRQSVAYLPVSSLALVHR